MNVGLFMMPVHHPEKGLTRTIKEDMETITEITAGMKVILKNSEHIYFLSYMTYTVNLTIILKILKIVL